jgi:hypothetical protein
MKLFVAIFGSLLLVAVVAFCLFGFLATFEPTDNALAFGSDTLLPAAWRHQ